MRALPAVWTEKTVVKKRGFTKRLLLCYDNSVQNALIGKKGRMPSLQRAAGRCKAVGSAVTLPLEQPAEQADKVGPDGVPPVIKGGHFTMPLSGYSTYQEEWYHGGFFTFVSCMCRGRRFFLSPTKNLCRTRRKGLE